MLSIILVKYKAEKEFQECIKSLAKSKVKKEIIVIDNNKINRGYAVGNNLGVKQAKGQYLMILNPDTIVFPGSIDKLVAFLDNNPEYSIVAPQLLDARGKAYPFQGTDILTPKHGIWGLSFINKLILDREYWLPKEVKIVPGTAFMMRKKDFVGFDENFFLYFEEADLCMRTPGKKHILKTAEIIHHWARTTPNNSKIKEIFEQSRFYFFKKHYGIIWATLVHLVCSISKMTVLWGLCSLISLGFLVLSFKSFVFFGDALWFYNSAINALLNVQFPLLGITASLTWLHQGPLWTFMLVPALLFSKFNLVSGQFLTIFLWILLIPNFYYLISMLFNKNTAKIMTTFLMLNPYSINNAVMPYHTSPIPLFEVLFLLLLIKRKDFLSGLFMGFLYQLHLLTFIFWPLLVFRINKKTFFGFILGMLPFIITGPKQILQLLIWVFRSALTGFRDVNLASEAYIMVFYIPGLIFVALILHKLPKLLKMIK